MISIHPADSNAETQKGRETGRQTDRQHSENRQSGSVTEASAVRTTRAREKGLTSAHAARWISSSASGSSARLLPASATGAAGTNLDTFPLLRGHSLETQILLARVGAPVSAGRPEEGQPASKHAPTSRTRRTRNRKASTAESTLRWGGPAPIFAALELGVRGAIPSPDRPPAGPPSRECLCFAAGLTRWCT